MLERMLDPLLSAATLLGFMCPAFLMADHISGPHREVGRDVGWELVGNPSFGDGCFSVHDVMLLVILYAVLYCKPLSSCCKIANLFFTCHKYTEVCCHASNPLPQVVKSVLALTCVISK